MTDITIPYGRKHLTARLDASFKVQVLAPARVPALADPAQAVRHALAQPVGPTTLEQLVSTCDDVRPSPTHSPTVAIAINDKTRPAAYGVLLPPLLEELEKLGVPPAAICFLIATGLHGPMAQSEFEQVLPSHILSRFQVVSHDAAATHDLVDLGRTRRGTPVLTNKFFAQASLRLVVGNIEPHQFMGFSGGVKTAVIGLAGRETISTNHAMMMDPASDLARYDDNPCRGDVEEMGRMMGVHFALNAVLNESKQIVHAFAGEPQAVMREGIPAVLRIYGVQAQAPFDLVIASPGGHPKDINLYQAQKALGHAARVTRPDGSIILVAACPEGTGSHVYEEWILGQVQGPSSCEKATPMNREQAENTKSKVQSPVPKSHEEVIARFKSEGFRIGPHKAFQIARDAVGRKLFMVTEMPAPFVKSLLLNPCATLDEALSAAIKDLRPNARIGILPFANATIPSIVTPHSRADRSAAFTPLH
jgi:nickel-dependent lactate racemase